MVSDRSGSSAAMRSAVAEMPTHLRRAFSAAVDAGAHFSDDIRRVVVAGMGGSAIGADLLQSVTDAETPFVLRTVRDARLPRWVDGGTGFVAVSYSGNTWETLAAFEEAGRRGCPRIALSAREGTLAAEAKRSSVPHVAVPSGLPPRAALGLLFGSLLGVFDNWFSPSNRSRVDSIVRTLEDAVPKLGSARSPPARLAQRIGARFPWISATPDLAPAARRWSTQIAENGKGLAHWDLFPELFHNAIVGWNALAPREARRFFWIRLEGADAGASLRAGMDHLSRLIGRRGVPTARLRFDSADHLERLLLAALWGDYLSLAIAEGRRVDPTEIEAITRLKSVMASAAAPPSSRKR
jgi:glucose/mannose-6-phosphate isomerase